MTSSPSSPNLTVHPGLRFLQATLAIAWKDLIAELRSLEILTVMVIFALLVILIFNFALELDPITRITATPGILWAIFAFAGTLGLNRSMAIEKDRGSMDGLLLAPVDRSAIFFGKMISNLAFMLAVEVVTLPIYSFLYNMNLFRPGFLLVILLGSIGYAGAGTLLASMAVQTRTRDALLPILLFPVIIPLLLALMRASGGYLQGLTTSDVRVWLNLILVYDVVFLTVAYMVFGFVVEE